MGEGSNGGVILEVVGINLWGNIHLIIIIIIINPKKHSKLVNIGRCG